MNIAHNVKELDRISHCISIGTNTLKMSSEHY